MTNSQMIPCNPPTSFYSAKIRAALKAAQKSGLIDPAWKIRVRIERNAIEDTIVIRVNDGQAQCSNMNLCYTCLAIYRVEREATRADWDAGLANYRYAVLH